MNQATQIANLKDVNLNLLIVLRVLLRTTSVSRTAEILGISQPSVSKALKELRTTLGDPLLVRASNTMYRTERAKQLSTQLEHIFADIEDVFSNSSSFDPTNIRRSITIGCNEYLQASIGTAVVNDLVEAAPLLTLCFRPISEDVPKRLADGGLDFILGTDNRGSRNLRAQGLYQERFVCVAHRDTPPFSPAITLKNFCEHPQIDVSPSGTDMLTRLIEHQILTGRERRNVVLTVSSYYLIPPLIDRFGALALVPSKFCRISGFMDTLRVVPLAFEEPKFNVGMYWHNVTHYDPLLSWVRSRIVAMYEAPDDARCAPTDP